MNESYLRHSRLGIFADDATIHLSRKAHNNIYESLNTNLQCHSQYEYFTMNDYVNNLEPGKLKSILIINQNNDSTHSQTQLSKNYIHEVEQVFRHNIRPNHPFSIPISIVCTRKQENKPGELSFSRIPHQSLHRGYTTCSLTQL